MLWWWCVCVLVNLLNMSLLTTCDNPNRLKKWYHSIPKHFRTRGPSRNLTQLSRTAVQQQLEGYIRESRVPELVPQTLRLDRARKPMTLEFLQGLRQRARQVKMEKTRFYHKLKRLVEDGQYPAGARKSLSGGNFGKFFQHGRNYDSDENSEDSEKEMDLADLSEFEMDAFPNLTYPQEETLMFRGRKRLRKDDYQQCGFSHVLHSEFLGSRFRIVGGKKAQRGAWPWVAAMGYREVGKTETEYDCGGSLISDQHVLTASHCLVHPELHLYSVRLGELNLYRDDDGASPLEVLVDRYVSHEGFSWVTAANDIGVVFLASKVTFTPDIHPVCLPRSKEMVSSSFEKMLPFVVGWGVTESGSPSDYLKEVQVPVVSLEICRRVYDGLPPDKRIPITPKQLCCGFEEGKKDACQGDSGGPLVLSAGHHPRGNIYYLVGVVSMGEGCAVAGIPGVYTRVTAYLDWIDNVTRT